MRRIRAPHRVGLGRVVGCCAAIVLVSGCATDPGRITGLGTATGGVLGAGFGALIGAQTGDPGTGLIVGGAAGSVAGAVVANAFEAEERYLDSNRTLMRQRDEEIGRRREQLAALRTQESGRDFEVTERPSFPERRSSTLGRSIEPKGETNNEMSRPSSLSALSIDAEDVRPIYVERKNGINGRSGDVLTTQPRDERYGSTVTPSQPKSAASESAPKDVPLKKSVKVESAPSLSRQNEVKENAGTPAISGRRNSWVVAEKGKGEIPEAVQPEVKRPVSAAVPISKESAPAKVVLPVRKAPGLATEESDNLKIKQTAPSKEALASARRDSREVQKIESSTAQQRNVVGARAIPAAPTVDKPRPTAVPPTAVPHSAAKDVAIATPTVATSESAKAPVGDAGVKRSSGECSQAAQEIEKSVQVSEPSEKLFHYRRALRLCPSDARYHINLGDHYRSLNRFADASFEYKEALALDPKNAEAKDRMEKLKNG